MAPRRFRLADTAQQILGGFLLAGPFVVTEEVWSLAKEMTWVHSLLTVAIVVAVGYGALYEADVDRDPDREEDIVGIPLRFLSLMIVAYGSVISLAVILAAPSVFLANVSPSEQVAVTIRAVGIGAVFSVVGAASADSLF